MAANLAKHLHSEGQVSSVFPCKRHQTTDALVLPCGRVDANTQPPLMLYNRSTEGITKFKNYATSKDVPEGSYTFVEDLPAIGEK
jgi:hypothetical protein